MKKTNLMVALLLGLGTVALASCSISNDSKDINSASDFVEVAKGDTLKIATANVMDHKLKSSDTSTAGTTLKLSIYNNDDCTASGKVTYEGKETNLSGVVYTATYGNVKQQFYIDTTTKKGTVYNSTTEYAWFSELVKESIVGEYEEINAYYEDFKSYVGKSAADLGYTSYSLRRSIATNVAGYVLHAISNKENVETETYRYITLDKINGEWVFTNYSERIATTTVDDKGYSNTVYDVSEATFEIVDSYSNLVISLSDYTISGQNTDDDGIQWSDFGILSAK